MFLGDRFSILLPIALLGAFSIADAQTSHIDNRPRTASISGRVTISGKAAANAKIVITEIKDGPGLANQGFPTASSGLNAGEEYVVLTDAEGRYRLTNLPGGRYEAQTMLKGCVKEKHSQSESLVESFSLDEGESRENVDFTLVRGGVITGRVTDADGRPLIARLISLLVVDEQGRKTDASGLREMADLLIKADMIQTDDRGVYRIYGLRAGRYLVSVGGDSNRAISLLTGAGGEYPRTWYPDATDENLAEIIEVGAGSEVTGVDIKLGNAKRTYEAAGRVVDDETGNPIAGSALVCVKLNATDESAIIAGAAFGGVGGNTKTDNQGNFRLVGLAPGQYQLSLGNHESILTGSSSDHYSDGAKLEIQSSDVAGIEIRAKRGATISGVAIVKDADPSAKQVLSQMMIMAALQPLPPNEVDENGVASAMTPAISPIGSDGGFILKGVRPGNVTFEVYGLTGNRFEILQIERGGADIRDGIVVTEREDITGVRVILGKGSGVIRGQVNVTGGALPKGFQMEVSADRVKDSISADFSGSGSVDNKGRFVIEGLLPGEWVLKLMLIPPPEHDLNVLNVLKSAPVTQKVILAKGQEAQVTMTLDLSKKNQEEK
jgi:protocatechuate 3,4-dioxygenase beta subunit